MELLPRVRGLLLKPKDEWLKIKAEPTPIAELFTSYAMILAAVPPAAQFAGRLLFRSEIPFSKAPVWSFGRALTSAILSYIFSLAIVYLFAVIVDALAPNFASARSLPNAMKLAVYSMTPVWMAGVVYLIPGLGILVLLAGVYGLYLLYEGLRAPMMGTPKDRVMGFLVVSIIVVVALFVVAWLLLFVLSFHGRV
ncbi:MAG TPA: Yip1 family protein [Terriglobales bacterium]|nr:Yip1 family protein [Terriglobales bacterium]